MNNTCGDGIYTRELVALIDELYAALADALERFELDAQGDLETIRAVLTKVDGVQR
jgi:hypothetical protein